MLQPRSFLFTRSNPSRSREIKHERPSNEPKTRSPPKQDKTDMSTTTTTTTTETLSRPTTPSSPVIIPMRGHHESAHEGQRSAQQRRNHGRKSDRSERRAQTVHSPDALP